MHHRSPQERHFFKLYYSLTSCSERCSADTRDAEVAPAYFNLLLPLEYCVHHNHNNSVICGTLCDLICNIMEILNILNEKKLSYLISSYLILGTEKCSVMSQLFQMCWLKIFTSSRGVCNHDMSFLRIASWEKKHTRIPTRGWMHNAYTTHKHHHKPQGVCLRLLPFCLVVVIHLRRSPTGFIRQSLPVSHQNVIKCKQMSGSKQSSHFL